MKSGSIFRFVDRNDVNADSEEPVFASFDQFKPV